MMEQNLMDSREVSNWNLARVGDLACERIKGTRCELPLGKSMTCGDARRREDRKPNSVIVSGDYRSHDIWFIRSGIMRLQRHGYDGRRQIVSLFFPGEIVGFEGEFREGITVESATQSSLCRMDRRSFDRMVDQNDALRNEVFRQKQDQLDRLHWLTWSLGALSPEERLCGFLTLASKFMPYHPLPDGTAVLSMLLPRRDIADLLGTTVETISRSVHKLADTGIIEIKDPAHFRFMDLPGLIALGKIDSHFDKMAFGLARRRGQLGHLATAAGKSSVCFCGG